MEYVRQHGAFDDVPLARIVADFARCYPRMYGSDGFGGRDADFQADVERETEGR